MADREIVMSVLLDSHAYIAEARIKAWRMVAAATSKPAEGLAQAARIAKRSLVMSGRMAKLLINLDTAFNVTKDASDEANIIFLGNLAADMAACENGVGVAVHAYSSESQEDGVPTRPNRCDGGCQTDASMPPFAKVYFVFWVQPREYATCDVDTCTLEVAAGRDAVGTLVDTTVDMHLAAGNLENTTVDVAVEQAGYAYGGVEAGTLVNTTDDEQDAAGTLENTTEEKGQLDWLLALDCGSSHSSDDAASTLENTTDDVHYATGTLVGTTVEVAVKQAGYASDDVEADTLVNTTDDEQHAAGTLEDTSVELRVAAGTLENKGF